MTDEQPKISAGLRDLLSRSVRRPSTVVRFEQAVYGSFPFRDQGYALLAQSPGCRDGWRRRQRLHLMLLLKSGGAARAPRTFGKAR